MGTKVLAGYLNAGGRKGKLAAACFYDSVTMSSFGPVITVSSQTVSIEEILELGEEFLEFVEVESGADARTVLNSDLHDLLVRFLKEHEEKENEEMMKGGAA